MKRFGLAMLALLLAAPAVAGQYKNFRTAIYVTVTSTKALADAKVFEAQYGRAVRQLKFDKVYVEVYRNRVFATDQEIETVKKEFEAKGVIVAGGVTLAAGGQGGQFGTFDYEAPADRAECQKAAELAARHFNQVILDDFFFYNTKSDADIAAKGSKSWTEYRLDKMREVAQDLVLGPARAVNPNVKMIIKYPNWYEHFQGLGYDLEKESQMFDAIHTGTETRDPFVTDQLLQQYESYEIVRYFDNIRPDGNGGGWVDTYGTTYVDRYPEQLWDTLFAKAPEIALFNWEDLVAPHAVEPGNRAVWTKLPTSFDWSAMVKSYRPSGKADPGPGWGSVAGYALEQVDKLLGQLGKPIGIASYKPYQSSGEDYLQDYLGNVGLPIEMTPEFPSGDGLVLLTEEAKDDPDIVKKIEVHLAAGGSVVVTSGFLRAMQDKGFKDVAEWEDTGRSVAIHEYLNGFGAGSGTSLYDPKAPAVLFPEIHFYTNDSWGIVRGVAGAKGFPILLMNRYSKGVIYELTIPENMADLYNLPQGVLTRLKAYLQSDFPVRLDAPALISLFAYDNNTFVIESYRAASSSVEVSVAGANRKLRDLETGKLVPEVIEKKPVIGDPRRNRGLYQEPPRSAFAVRIEPHSYRAYQIER
jgi:hypothetical protein